jgi:VanZ family protein
MTRERSKRLHQLAIGTLVAYWIALVLGTHWPQLPDFNLPENGDKILHFTAYAGLTFLLSLSLFWSSSVRWWQWIALAVGVAVFGGLDELTQPPFGRTADWYDWYADVTGLTIGLLLGIAANQILRR